MATLARMHVELIARADRYHREMRRAQSATDSLRTGLHRLQSAVLLVTGATGFGIAVKRTFEIGTAVEETASKFNTVFGPAVGEAQAFLDGFAHSAGLTIQQGQELTSTAAAIAQGLGFTQQASAEVSEQMLRMAADIASFNNTQGGAERVLQAMISALNGETEALKESAKVVVLQADVQARAAEMTGKATEQITRQDKALATLSLIAERAGVAMGDLERTQSGAANRARTLGARFREIRDAVATALIPVFEVFMREIENVLGGTATFTEWLKTSGPVMAAWAEVGVAAFRAVGEAIGATFTIVQAFGQMFVATAGAMVAVIMGDWQTFHTLADEIEQSWVDMGGAFVGVGDRMVELYDRVRIAMNAFGEATLTFVRPALDSTADGANAAADAVDRLAESLKKLNAITSFIGGLSRVPGLGFLGGLASIGGIISGILNPGAGLLGLFGGGAESAGGLAGAAKTAVTVGGKPNFSTGGVASGPIQIMIVGQDGKHLTDTITVNQTSHRNVRRVARVPVVFA